MPMCPCRKKATLRGVEVLSASECRQIVQCKLVSTDMEVLEVKTRTFSDTPPGFLGDYYLITIIISSNEKQISEIKLFVKTVPEDPLHSEFVTRLGAFWKETRFFKVLLPDLLKYRGDLKEDDGHLDWFCECYLTTPKKIVLEDLSARGFRNPPFGFFSMDYDHCVFVLKALASFHASSIIFEEKETQRTGKVCRLSEVHPDQFIEILWCSDEEHPSHKVFVAGIDCLSLVLKDLPGLEGDEKRHEDLVKRIRASYADMCIDVTRPSTKMRNVASHGDMWKNNILIRYSENDIRKPVEVKFVDYQLVRYTPPTHDFLAFLHLNTRRHMRDQHLLDFARTYHEALRAELTRHHLDVDSIVPWDQFEASFEHYRKFAVLISNTYCSLTNMDPEVLLAISKSQELWTKYMFVDRTEEAVRWFKKNATFKELMTECLDELVDILAI